MNEIKKLFDIAYEKLDFHEIQRHINHILSLKGSDKYRLAGSNWEMKTAEYIAEKLNEYGYKIDLQSVPVDIWTYIDGVIEVEDGYKTNVYTYAGISGGEEEGILTYIGKGDWNKDLNGKIVLINLDFNRYVSHVFPALEAFKRGAKAVLFTYLSDSGLDLHLDNTYYIYDGEPWLDGVIGVVRPGDAESLIDRSGYKASVRIKCQSIEGYSYNIIGYKGGDKPLTYVVSAHHDGYNPGVMDNLTGVAYILEMARLLSEYQPPYNLEFISFTAEEYGYRRSIYDYLIGSEYYFSNVDPRNYVLVFNIDIIGLKGLPIGINYTRDLNRLISDVASKLYDSISCGVQLSGRPSIWFDTWSAVYNGISALTINHLGDNYFFRRYYHTEKDDINLLDEDVFRVGFSIGYALLTYSMDRYPPYHLTELLRDVHDSLDTKNLKVVDRLRVRDLLDDLLVEMSILEYKLEYLSRLRKSSRILKLLGSIRMWLYKSIYRLGIIHPTERFSTYFPEYYNKLITDLEIVLYRLDKDSNLDIQDLIMDIGLNRWVAGLSKDTVNTILEMYRRGDKWGSGVAYPYINTYNITGLDGDRLRREIYSLIDKTYNHYREELDLLYKNLNDIWEVLGYLDEMVDEWISQPFE